MNESDLSRFWSRIDKDGKTVIPELGRCWKWKAGKWPFGYGRIWLGKVNTTAHRMSWLVHHGTIPPGLEVCHKCDNPECSNPQHLFLGTMLDNMLDKIKKGRSPKGEKSGHAVLKEKDIIKIRLLYSKGFTQTQISRMFNTTNQNIFAIVTRKNWKHI